MPILQIRIASREGQEGQSFFGGLQVVLFNKVGHTLVKKKFTGGSTLLTRVLNPLLLLAGYGPKILELFE